MKTWEERPIEIANNLNPAFCGELIYYMLADYYAETKESLPFPLVFLILPVILHKRTRNKIIQSRTQMSVWIHSNQDVKITFARRAKSLVPITIESIVFLIQYRIIDISDDGRIIIKQKINKRNLQVESERYDCIKKAKILGKWFGRSGTVETIYTMWGVRP